MWRELIHDFCPEATFSEPASDEAIAAAEAALGVSFPEELASVLRESNGVADDTGADVIWSCEKLVRQNEAYRANDDFADLYMPLIELYVARLRRDRGPITEGRGAPRFLAVDEKAAQREQTAWTPAAT